MGEAGVAGALEVVDDLRGADGRRGEGFRAQGPERRDPDGSGELVPLVGEIEVEEALAGAALPGVAIFEGEERGITDEEGGVGHAQHGVKIGRMRKEAGLHLPETRKEDAGVSGGGAGSGVEGDAPDAFDPVRMADDEDDRAHAISRGNGAAGDHGERWVGSPGGYG